MNNQTNKLIPELRFPEFKNKEEWESSTIGKVGKFYYGKSAPKWSLSPDAPTLCVRYGELYTKFDTVISEIKSRTNIDPSDLKFSKGGEILVPRVGEVARDFASHCCYLPFPNIAIGEMISVYETEEYGIFYTYYFRTLEKEFARVVEGQNVKNLYYVNLEPIAIGKPIIEEQQKIAYCLSSLDEVITAHTNKLETLKNHKKGLMQNLFPQEGDKGPKLRFKEFENNSEWIERKIKSIFSIFQGFAFSSNDSVSNGTRWLKIADVGIQQMKEENPSFLPIHYRKNYEKFLVKKGDYVLALTRPILNMKLKIAPVDDIFHNALLNQRVGKIVSSNCISFIYYLLHTQKMVTSINSNIAGNEPPNLSFQQIENILVKLPSDIEEQQKIAETLSSLDKLITEQSNKIKQLKSHKKGLMQGLFPKIQN